MFFFFFFFFFWGSTKSLEGPGAFIAAEMASKGLGDGSGHGAKSIELISADHQTNRIFGAQHRT